MNNRQQEQEYSYSKFANKVTPVGIADPGTRTIDISPSYNMKEEYSKNQGKGSKNLSSLIAK